MEKERRRYYRIDDEAAISMQVLPAGDVDTKLSAQGIAFHDDNTLQQGSLAELNLKLLPSGLRLVIIARVVQVETEIDHDEGANKVSLDFEYLHQADREILIKHIHGKQMESLSSAQVL